MNYLRWIGLVCGMVLFGSALFTASAFAAVSFDCQFTCAEFRVINSQTYFRAIAHTEVIQLADGTTVEQCTQRDYTQASCAQTCRATCGGRNVDQRSSIGQWRNGEQGCLNSTSIPSYIAETTDTARASGEITEQAARETLIDSTYRDRSSASAAPRCSARSATAAEPGAAASQCTESTNIQNDQQGKCVFYCIRPEAGTGGTVERRESSLPAIPGRPSGGTSSCRRGSLERREGTNACAVGSVCGCQQECMTTCGNASDGKSLCYMGTDNTRSVDLCRDNVSSEAATPICSRDPNAPVRGSQHTLTNPLGTSSIAAIVARIVKAVTGIVGSVALLMFVVAGIMWMTAESSDRVDTAKTIFKNASFGLVLIFFSYSLVSLLLSILGL